jgi:hypothetical protein
MLGLLQRVAESSQGLVAVVDCDTAVLVDYTPVVWENAGLPRE